MLLFFVFPKDTMTDFTADNEWLAKLDTLTVEELRDEAIRWRAIARSRQNLLAALKARDGRMWEKWGELADKPINDDMLLDDVNCISSELDHAFFVLVDFAIGKVR